MRNLVLLTLGIAALAAAQRLPAHAINTDQRIAAIEKRLKDTPKSPAILNELAGAYMQKMRETADGNYLTRCSKIVDGILAADPKNYDARRRQIEVEMMLHHFQHVVELTGELAQERPDDPVLWGLRGDALMEMGDYDHAPDAYQKMVDIKPTLASYNRVSFYRFVTGDATGAIKIMRQAISMGAPLPENVAWCLSDLGNMLVKVGDYDAAEDAYNQALRYFPGYHHALAGLGTVYAWREKYQLAIDSLLQAQAKAPFPQYAGMLARIYRLLGKTELANQQLALLDVSEQLGKAAGEAANRNLSLAYSDLDCKPARALELAEAELNVRRDVYTYDALAWALLKNGRAAEAAGAIQKALAQNSPEPSFHDHAARIYEALGRTADAEHQRQLAVARAPRRAGS